MGKKKKPNSAPSRSGNPSAAQRDAARAAAAPRKPSAQAREMADDDVSFTDLFKDPLLIVAWASLLVTTFAIWAAIHFRNDLTMGELSEPTHLVVWGAITFTLFASCWRRQRRDKKTDS